MSADLVLGLIFFFFFKHTQLYIHIICEVIQITQSLFFLDSPDSYNEIKLQMKLFCCGFLFSIALKKLLMPHTLCWVWFEAILKIYYLQFRSSAECVCVCVLVL